MFKTLRSSFLAGICISLGGIAFMKVGGLEGAILFTFGLLTVVHYALKLYTGTAGFFKVETPSEWAELIFIIIGNAIGCCTMAMLVQVICPEIVETAGSIAAKRESAGFIACSLNAVCCGFIMTTAVQFGRKNHFLPLLFGVPLFIMCGFTHSIADAFYFLTSIGKSSMISKDLVFIWWGEIAGNFIGCNLYRMLCLKKT
jgi:formate/nitrite transporter FocA (FNT family)